MGIAYCYYGTEFELMRTRTFINNSRIAISVKSWFNALKTFSDFKCDHMYMYFFQKKIFFIIRLRIPYI